jgi:hypothetical protein
MRYLGFILTLLLSAASTFAGTESFTVAATSAAWSRAIPVFSGSSLYTQGSASGAGTLVGVDVDLEVAVDAAGPWVDAAAPAVAALLDFTDVGGGPELLDATTALTGHVYVRYKVDNITAGEVTVDLTWGLGGESLKPGLGAEDLRLFKRSVGNFSDISLEASGSSVLPVVYTKGYGQVTAWVGGGATGAGTLLLEKSASRDGPWIEALAADAWVAGTEEAHFFAADDGAHYWRATLTDTSAAANTVPFHLQPR